MLSFNLRNSLTLLVVGFILGFFSTFLFTDTTDISSAKKELARLKNLKKESVNLEKNYQKQVESLQGHNFKLQQDLEITKGLLKQEKQLAKQKEFKIKKVIQLIDLPAKDILAKRDSLTLHRDITPPCDSLTSLVTDYMEGNHIKDSLYENELTQMDSIVSVKDDLIQVNEKAYSNLNLRFSQSLNEQESLAKENKLLKKKFRRQRLKNRLATVGLMILTATTTKILLRY